MLIRRADDAPDGLIGPKLRVWTVARGLVLQWRDAPDWLYEVYAMGEANFIALMRRLEIEQAPAAGAVTARPMHEGLSDAQWGEVYEYVVRYVQKVAAYGKWRKRKDTRMSFQDFQRLCGIDP